jgi:hemerythrin
MKKKIDQNKLIWKSEFSIGNYRIDNEHIKLFEIAKKALNTKKNNTEDVQKLKSIIKSLYEYIGTHFKNEETFMAEIEYPDLPRHKTIHKTLLENLHQFIQTLNDLTIDEIEKQLYDFIEDYFIKHILKEDKRIEIWNLSLKRLRKSTYWLKSYETGNKQIDEEHKEMFEILNDAFLEVEDEHKEEKIKKVLKRLYDFIKTHFKEEEAYMKNIDYPQYKEHLELHSEIIIECNNLLERINDMKDSLFERELAKIIDRDIITHILQEDKKIVYWENQNR